MNRISRRAIRKDAMCATLFKVRGELSRKKDLPADRRKQLRNVEAYLINQLSKITYTEIYAKDDHMLCQQMLDLVDKLQGNYVDVHTLRQNIKTSTFRARFRAITASKNNWRVL